MKSDNEHEFLIVECSREGDPRDEQYVTYIVKYGNEALSLLLIELRITLDAGTDDLMIREVYIPISTSGPKVLPPADDMIGILKSLTDEGLFEHIPAAQQDNPDYFYFQLDDTYRINACFYQQKYYAELEDWLCEFLEKTSAITRVLKMVKSDHEG